MKTKLLISLLFNLLLILIFPSFGSFAYGQSETSRPDCTLDSISQDSLEAKSSQAVTITVKTKEDCFTEQTRYVFSPVSNPNDTALQTRLPQATMTNPKEITFTWTHFPLTDYQGTQTAVVCEYAERLGPDGTDCDGGLKLTIPFEITTDYIPTLNYVPNEACVVEVGDEISFQAENLRPNTSYVLFYPTDVIGDDTIIGDPYETASDETSHTFTITAETAQENERVCILPEEIFQPITTDEYDQNCVPFDVIEPGSDESTNRQCVKTTPAPPEPPCTRPDRQDGKFVGCKEIHTGLGFAISTNPAEFVSDIFTFLLSISGGILLLLIIYSGYQMMTSQGDPERIQAARERITSAIIGFMFLVFSLVILEIIGVNILRIPGFSGTSNRNAAYEEMKSNHLDELERRANRPTIRVEQRAPTSAPLPSQPAKDPSNCGQEGKTPCLNSRTNNDGCRAGLQLRNGVCREIRSTNTSSPQTQGFWSRLRDSLFGKNRPSPTPTPRRIRVPSPTRRPASLPTVTPTRTPSSLPTVTPAAPGARCPQQTGPCTSAAHCASMGCTNHTCVIPPGYPDDALCKQN